MRRSAVVIFLPLALAACGGVRDLEWSRPGGKVDPTAQAPAEVECRETVRMAAGGVGNSDASDEAMAGCMHAKGYVQEGLGTAAGAE